MGYVEKMMGDLEKEVYRTHPHWIVLLQRIVGWLLAFLVFLGFAIAVFQQKNTSNGDYVRSVVGLIVLCSLIFPLFWIVRPIVRGERGRSLFKAIWKPALAAILILAVALALLLDSKLWQISAVGAALALIPLYELIRITLDWVNERYVITNRRVMEVKGIINKHVRDSALEKVNDVDMNQSFIGRILNYGTVEIITGSDVGVNVFHRISNPVRFKVAMLNAKETLQQIPGVATGEGIARAPAPAAAKAPAPDAAKAPAPDAAEAVAALTKSMAAGDVPDLIKELDELRQKGLITEEEFQAKKKELLDRM